MNIAVPTQDGRTIAHHFGRARAFMIFGVVDGTVTGHALRDNTFTGHAKKECHGDHDDDHPHHSHGHDAIVAALKDCEAVLCYGMGRRAAEALREGGIKAFILQEQVSPRVAVEKYIAGQLATAGDFCSCHG